MAANTNIKVIQRDSYAELSITLPDSGRVASVTIYFNERNSWRDESVEVNWSALGACSPADATAYAALLAESAHRAAQRQHGISARIAR